MGLPVACRKSLEVVPGGQDRHRDAVLSRAQSDERHHQVDRAVSVLRGPTSTPLQNGERVIGKRARLGHGL